MHELGIAESILKTVVEKAKDCGAKKVTAVGIKLGDMEMLTPEALRESFNMIASGSIAGGAELSVEIIPGHEVIVDRIEVETD